MDGRWAVTGSSGFVGSALCHWLARQGKTVLRLQRSPGQEGCVPFELGRPLPLSAFDGVDVLVHCAYDFRPRAPEEIERLNVKGSRLLLQAARDAGIRRLVFVSSASAYPGCCSLYGQAKLRVETDARELGGSVLRPGLVYADTPGGIAGALEKLTALPILPVVSGGHQPLFLVHRDDLLRVIERAGEGPVGDKPLFVAHSTPVAFREVLSLFARRHGRRVVLVSIPSRLAFEALRAAERIGVPTGFRSDSLVALLHPNPEPPAGEPFGERLRAFSDWVLGSPADHHN